MTACPLGLAGQCYCANQVSSFAAAEQSSQLSAKTAVLLLAHGSPENPDQVPEFLSYVTGGRLLPPPVVEEIRHRYSLIGFSPLPCWTLLQADQLSQSLKMPVFVGMRNWKPFINDAIAELAAAIADFAQPHARISAERVARTLGVPPSPPSGLQASQTISCFAQYATSGCSERCGCSSI